MNKFILHILSLCVLLASCATEKVGSDPEAFGAKDYAYIEKFHEGVRLKTKGRVDEAIQRFEACLSIRQDDDAVFFALSQLELMRGDLLKSSEYILKAAELDPENTWYTQELAYMYYEQKDLDKSLENFKKLVDLEPRNVDWQYAYSGVLQEAGKNEAAIAVLNKLEDLVGINPELCIEKYELYMKMRNAEKALDEINRARETYPKELSLLATLVDHYFRAGEEQKAVGLLEELVEADPLNGRAFLALADVYRASGREAESWVALKKAFLGEGVELDTKMNILMRIQETSVTLPTEAFELAEILVNAHPTEAKAHSIQGDFFLYSDRTTDALKSYRKALQYDNTKYPIWNQVLVMEYQAGEYTSLYTHSKECLSLFPAMPTVYLLNGVGAIQMKKYEEALDALSAGRALVVKDVALEAEFYAQTGDAYFGLKEYQAGKENYERAIELDPYNNLTRVNFAYNLAMANKDLDLAESLAKRASETTPDQAQIIDVLGFVYFRKGNYTEALSLLTRAAGLNPNDALIADHLGDAHALSGDLNEAVIWWKKAKELGGKNKQLDRKIEEKKYHEPQF
jgi:tetratricopeptide (TPR) repeat protein